MSATVARNAAGAAIDIQEILVLPHRFPFLLVDRVLALNPARTSWHSRASVNERSSAGTSGGQ
jgi:3-hydroxymyristoyl/3-hydroxydecanoyl-(acyl carrier protein) dehydratase